MYMYVGFKRNLDLNLILTIVKLVFQEIFRKQGNVSHVPVTPG